VTNPYSFFSRTRVFFCRPPFTHFIIQCSVLKRQHAVPQSQCITLWARHQRHRSRFLFFLLLAPKSYLCFMFPISHILLSIYSNFCIYLLFSASFRNCTDNWQLWSPLLLDLQSPLAQPSTIFVEISSFRDLPCFRRPCQGDHCNRWAEVQTSESGISMKRFDPTQECDIDDIKRWGKRFHLFV
jgi:hypothetical protein